jgi:hypothetical protein
MISPHGVDGSSVDELAGFGRFIGARFEFFPIELHSCGFQNALGGCSNLGSDAFAGNQSDFVSRKISYPMMLIDAQDYTRFIWQAGRVPSGLLFFAHRCSSFGHT